MPKPDYQQHTELARRDPEAFWATQADSLHWHKRWDSVLDEQQRWFSGGELNTCYNALDRHVLAGHGEHVAIAWDSPVSDSREDLTYATLLEQTARLAGAMQALGVGHGDRVIIYMPMVPQAICAMLACARIGAVHSVVFGGFAARELATRIDDARPRLILSASCGIEPGRVIEYKPLLDQAIEICAHPPAHCLILQRPQLQAALQAPRDLDWESAVAGATQAPVTWVKATDPLYILYTSGTTGQPKGVVRDNGGHAVALNYSMNAVYGMQPGEVFWAASDIGWVVGHSYICYAPLLFGCTSVMYEGKPIGTPDAGAFWRVIQQHRVAVLFTAPTAFRAIKREDPQGELLSDYDTSSLRTLFLAGEKSDTATLNWAQRHLSVPAIDHWWQTETGWPIVANCQGLSEVPIRQGSPGLPVAGYQVEVLDEQARPVAANTLGNIVLRLPLPPGCLSGLWRAQQRFHDSYLKRYPGYYLSGDAGHIDEDGFIWIMSRIDDVINVAGHRLSTGAMEEVLSGHPQVAEVAVVGIVDALKGAVPLGLVVLNAGVEREHEQVGDELIARVREHIGAVAALRRVVVVKRLPKTRSGKVLRSTIAALANGSEWQMPATIDDPLILEEIRQALDAIGLARSTSA